MRRSVLVAVLCALTLSGCVAPAAEPTGSNETGSIETGFNETDVMFLQMMVPHHHQGIAIAQVAAQRSPRPEVATLAAAIEATQTDEATTMADWLAGWSQPASADPAAHAAHGGMPGTSEAEISALRSASDVEFERMFLNMMIAHQDDAVQLARMETSTGVNASARDLANRIDRSRTAQIAQMLALLDPSRSP